MHSLICFVFRTCTHTDFFNENVAANAEDWWRVDLLKVYNVTRIEVYTWYGQPLKLDGTVVSKSSKNIMPSIVFLSWLMVT